MNNFLKSLSLFGLVVFTILFISTFFMSDFLKEKAHSFIKSEMVQGAKEEFGLITKKVVNLTKFSMKLSSKKDEKLSFGDKYLAELLEPFIVEVMDRSNGIKDYRLKSPHKFSALNSYLVNQLFEKQQKIKKFLRMKYEDILAKLTLELQVFTAGNMLLYLLLFIILLKNKKISINLLYPISIITFFSLAGVYFYLFNQNWFFTILYSDYMGMQYFYILGMMALMFYGNFFYYRSKSS